MSNVIQIRDTQGNALYPITDATLVIGLQDGPFSEYVVSWNGSSTPTVANIPAGVVVTYNGTNYTGTMAASASTACKVYLVASTTQSGEYDRYITTHTGSTYAWTALGSTQIQSPVVVDNLTTNDATKALSAKQGKILGENVGQLEAKVDDLSTGKYYGYFAKEEDLPEADVDGFAYVGEGPTYTIYNLRGGVWTSSEITVNQSPIGNDEDIDQNEDGKLQFANRVYNAQHPNGMGYKILRADKTFASQVTATNTIYEIRYDFDLNNTSVTIPTGCVLKFNGGKILGGTLELSNTTIIGNSVCFDRVVFIGNYKQTAESVWFANFNSFLELSKLSKKGVVSSDIEIENDSPFLLSNVEIDLGGNTITHSPTSTDALFSIGRKSILKNGTIRAVYTNPTLCTLVVGQSSKTSNNPSYFSASESKIEGLTLVHSDFRPNNNMDCSIYLDAVGYYNVRFDGLVIRNCKCGVKFHFRPNQEGANLMWLTDLYFHNILISYSEYGFKVDNESSWNQFSACVFDSIRLIFLSDDDTFDYEHKDSIGFNITGGPNVFTNITHFNDSLVNPNIWQPTLFKFEEDGFQNAISNIISEGKYIEGDTRSGVRNSFNNILYTTYGGIRTSEIIPLKNYAVNQPFDIEVTKRAVPLQGVESPTRGAWFFTTYVLPESSSLLYSDGSDDYGEFLNITLGNEDEKLVVVRSNGMRPTTFNDKIFGKFYARLSNNDWLAAGDLDLFYTTIHVVLNDNSDLRLATKRSPSYNQQSNVMTVFQSWDFGETLNTDDGEVLKSNVKYLYFQLAFTLKRGVTEGIKLYRDGISIFKEPIYPNAKTEYIAGAMTKTDDTNYSLIDWENKPYIPDNYVNYCDAYFPNIISNLCQKDQSFIFESSGSVVKAYYFVGRASQPHISNKFDNSALIFSGTSAPTGMKGKYLAFVSGVLKKYNGNTWENV